MLEKILIALGLIKQRLEISMSGCVVESQAGVGIFVDSRTAKVGTFFGNYISSRYVSPEEISEALSRSDDYEYNPMESER